METETFIWDSNADEGYVVKIKIIMTLLGNKLSYWH